MAKVAKAVEEWSAKLEVEKIELLNQLEVQQVDLQELCQNLSKVMSLKEKLKAAEEKLLEVAKRKVAFREVAIEEPKLEAIKEFRQFEELSTSLDKSYKDRYDKDVKEIFFIIWCKRCEVDFPFLGKEF